MANKTRVITLRLQQPDDLFVLPQTDLFSEFRNYRTGIELVLSELRSRDMRADVELRLLLPEDEISEGLEDRISAALERYCTERIHYNRREKKALRLDGTTGLTRIGLPIAFFGLVITYYTAHLENNNEGIEAVLDHLGWVFAWLGLWWPLDAIFFSPHTYSRENKALRQLIESTVVIEPNVAGSTLINPLDET